MFVDSDAAPMLEHAELDARIEGDQIAFGLTPTGHSNGAAPGV